MFEHLSMGQAFHPPKKGPHQCAIHARTRPFHPLALSPRVCHRRGTCLSPESRTVQQDMGISFGASMSEAFLFPGSSCSPQQHGLKQIASISPKCFPPVFWLFAAQATWTYHVEIVGRNGQEQLSLAVEDEHAQPLNCPSFHPETLQ